MVLNRNNSINLHQEKTEIQCFQTELSKYQIITKLSKGSFGTTYLAKNLDGTTVVVKIIKKSCERTIKKIENEIKIPQMFNHVNIVKIIDKLDTKSHSYIIYPYIPNSRSLYMFKNGELDSSKKDNVRRILGYIDHVCDAIKVLHSKNIIHGDIKPHNIVASENIAFLIDFDLSENMNEPSCQLCSRISGTPNYLAPEIWSQQDNIDYKLTDIYSLGVTMYYLFNKRKLPYNAKNMEDLECRIRSYEPVKSNTGIKLLDKLIMSIISKDPNKRPDIDKIKRIIILIRNL